MTHLWLRAEQREHEQRVGLIPDGARQLLNAGMRVTIEESTQRCIPIQQYIDAGCEIVPENTWPHAPKEAIIFGLKELPEDTTPLVHRHIMFGHAFKGQPDGKKLLQRFQAGQGTLYDLEYLVDEKQKRIAAFGYWAGFAGAAVALKCWIAQQNNSIAAPIQSYDHSQTLLREIQTNLQNIPESPARILIIGALGRVGTGAADFCKALGLPVTSWDLAETINGGPFPEVLTHDIFLNCVLAHEGTPVFVPKSAANAPRNLRVIGDISCDPSSAFSPIKLYQSITNWETPALRVAQEPVLDITAIDNLPSLLPKESAEDFAQQLLPALLRIDDLTAGVWGRAHQTFLRHCETTSDF